MTSPKIGIGIIVIKEKSVLLGKRKNAHGSGEWAFPGGHLEFLETPEACVFRELFEETGLIAEHIMSGPWTNNFFGNDKHYVTLFMFVTAFSGNLERREPHKCESWEWFSLEKLPFPLFAPIQTLIEKVGLDKLKIF